jgi:hypothetical protein
MKETSMKPKALAYALLACISISFAQASESDLPSYEENTDPNVDKSPSKILKYTEMRQDTPNPVLEMSILQRMNYETLVTLNPYNATQTYQNIKKEIQECLNQGSFQGLNDIYQRISNQTEREDRFFEIECKENGIILWPSQATYREAYLGELFYPRKEIKLFYEHDSNEYLLERMDILWSLAISSSFRNPQALYYLTRGLEKHIAKVSSNIPKFISQLYKKSLEDLEKIKGNEDVHFLRASDYAGASSWGGYNMSYRKALGLYAKSPNDLESRLQRLIINNRYVECKEKPTIEDYLALGREYPKAYVEAANLSDSFQEKIQYLTYARDNGYLSAILELGYLYDEAGSQEEALKHYKEYGDLGHPKGYISYSACKVGWVNIGKDYKGKTVNELKEVVSYLEKAQILNSPEASYFLGLIYSELFERNNEQEFADKSLKSFSKAGNLGDIRAYNYIRDSEDDHQTIAEHLSSKISQILTFLGYQ